MNKKEKALKRLKAQLEKEQGREITDAEMDQVEHFLRMLARMQVDWFPGGSAPAAEIKGVSRRVPL